MGDRGGVTEQKNFAIFLGRDAERCYKHLPPKDQRHLLEALHNLEANPHPVDVEQVGRPGHPIWRIRVGKRRILYTIDETNFRIDVCGIGNRGDVYKGLLKGKKGG
jgi:mRNA interferase RelE/StbE